MPQAAKYRPKSLPMYLLIFWLIVISVISVVMFGVVWRIVSASKKL
jgi:hypothetical protein